MLRVCLLSFTLLTCGRANEDMPAAPQAMDSNVVASEGGTATLRCLLHIYPPLKITWRFEGHTIDGNASRYRLKSDGALEINPLYRNDTGVYICLVKKDLVAATQEVHLVVNEQDCNQFREEYEQALECKYGMQTSTQDGCQRWKCREDPCAKANCSSREHCEAVELSSPSSQGDLYFAKCVAGDVCEPFKQECNELNKCSFGIQKITGTDGCERCKCKLDPCEKKSCTAGRRCVVQKYISVIDPKPLFSAICGTKVKAGACPTEDTSPYKERCNKECTDDADCRGVGKCCKRGCSRLCLLPVEQTSTYPLLSSACFRPSPCSTSSHGCCQDGKTPAHGPDFEGCCLLQAYGCCPDNRKPAEGPRLKGCGCQYALHGCCPDNVTIAQGPDNQGCGCQYTQHRCCPDRHTAASGPHNEGCACNTYQFGCCADGVTTANGPDQQGCHCRESKFGCCGDGETHATGPDSAGCDCSSSQHGCCHDGRTEATGSKFLGCTDAPKIKQAVCSMPTDQGPCHNFTAMWYYDMAYGGCSSFRYGGCDGNGNRFLTKEDCEDVCVKPSPEDVCKLPSVKGACVAQYQRWHYNSTQEQCTPFIYGGCLGNANNFGTRELCQKQCEPTSVLGQCSLPIDQGSCAGNYSRWGFNSKIQRCEQFIWGGCEGNSNRFSYEAVCQMQCTQSSQCTQPQKAGNCAEKEAHWSFSRSENRCLPFYYSGCGGNDNRFRSRETCEQTCPSAYVRDKCTLPAERSHCYTVDVYRRYKVRFFYDTTSQSCRKFSYSGCGGNENNFVTEAECRNNCLEMKTTITTTAPTTADICSDAIDAGPCNNTETRYAYDSELGRCVTFQYGGCGGTKNNFQNEAYCLYNCEPKQDICKLLNLQGSCKESLMRWSHDPNTDSWTLTYGGCVGNGKSEECRTGSAPVESTTPTPTTVIADGPLECRVPKALEDCRYGGEVWYFDSSRHECVSHANRKVGPVCRYNGTFLSQEACEQSCGVFRGVDVCKQRKDPGPCQSYVTKVYFDPSTGKCHEFNYGGCLGSANRFSSIEECSKVCNAEIEKNPCTLPLETHSCFIYVLQWYYDPSRNQCIQIVHYGCSSIRFETQRDCEARCKRPALITTTVATTLQQLSEPECRTPSSLAPCGKNVTVFYYDSERKLCLISGLGGCGHPNMYKTEEECERSCGAFRAINVCGANLDPGPCRDSISKIYWDAITGSCQPYAYGGCAGGPNRFSNVKECMSVCGDITSDPVRMAIGIAQDSKAEITGELGSPLMLHCRAYGDQLRYYMSWYRGYERDIWLFNNTVYEPRGNVLLIRNLTIDTLGRYTCQAIYEQGQSATRGLVVRAYMPKEPFMNYKWLVPRDALSPRPGIQPPNTTTTIEAPRPLSTETVLRARPAPRPVTQPLTTTITITTTTQAPRRVHLRRRRMRRLRGSHTTPKASPR